MSRTPSSSGFDNDFESDSEAGATMSPNAAAANPSAPPSAADAGPQVVAAAASATMAGVSSSPKLHAESNTTAAPSPAGPRADGSPVGDAATGATGAAAAGAGDGEATRPPPTGPTSDIMNRFKLLNFVQMVAAADVAHCIDAVGLDAIRHIAATEPPVEPTAPELVVGVRTRGYQSNAARRGQTHRGAATVPTASASGLPPSARLVHRAQRNAQDPTNRGPRAAAASRRDVAATGRSQPYAREPDPAGMARAMRTSPVVASRLGTAHPSPQPAVQRGSFGPPRDSGGTAAPPRPSGGSPPRNGGSVPRAAVDAIAQLMIRERQVREREMAIAQGHPTPPLSSEFLEAHQQQIGDAGHRIAGGARMPDGVSPVTGSGGGAVSPVSSFRPAHSGGRPQAVNFSGLQPPHAHPQHPYQNPGAVGGPQAAAGFNAPQVFPGAGPYGHPGQPQPHPQQPMTPWQQAAQRAAQHNAQQQGHHGPGLEAYRPGPIVDPHAAAQEDPEPRRSSSSVRSPIVDQSFEDEVARTRQEIQPHLNQLGASPHRGGSHPGHGHGQTSAGDSPSKNGRPRPMTAQALAEDRAFERSLHAAGHSPSGRNAEEDAELDRRIDSHQLSPSNGDPFQRSGSGMGSRRGSQGRTPHSGQARSHSRSPKRGSPSRHGIARGSSQPTSGEATAPNSGRRRPGSRSGHFVVFPHEDALDHETDRNRGTAHQFQQTSQPNSARTPRGHRDQFDDRVAHGGGNEELDQFDEEMLSAAEAERLHLRRLREEEKTRTGVLAEAAAALDAVLYEHDSVVTRQLQYEARKAPLPPLLTHSMGDDAKAAARRGADGASAHQQRDQWTQDQGYADGDSTSHIPRARADLPPLLPEAEVESAIRAPVRESVKKKPARHRGRMHQKMVDSIHRYKEQCVQAAQFNERIWNNSGLSAVTVADQFCDVVMEDLLTEVCVEASAALDECVDGIVDYELQGEHTAAVDDMVARAKSAFAGGPGQGGQTPPSSGRLPPRSQPSPKGAAAIAAAAAAKQQAAAVALGLAPAVNTRAIAGLDSIDPSTFGQQRVTEEERIRRAAAAADGGDISHVEFESRHPSSAQGVGAADELGAVTEEERQRREQSMGTLLGRLATRAHNEIGAPVPEAPFTAFAGDVGPGQPELHGGTTAGLQATLPSDAGTSPIPDLLSIPPGMISR